MPKKAPQSNEERLDRLLLSVNGMRDQMRKLESQVAALLRERVITEPPVDHVARLDRHRFAYMSQHEEDGLLHALFQEIGPTNRWFVEIGCGSNGGNAGFLARECGWSGLMIDAADRAFRMIQRQFEESRVTAVRTLVGSQGVLELLSKHECPVEFDLLGVDIDSTDYWVLEAITSVHRPRVIVVEYNSVFGREAAVTVPDAKTFERPLDRYLRHYHGASLGAFCKLAKRRSYRLLLTDPSGTNAVFVRNDVGADLPGTTAQKAFRYYLRHRVVAAELGDVIAYFRSHRLPLEDV